ncbi:MAG: hypothetical protein WA731_12865 [Pseudonocardiaceae bacterium]
MPKTVDRIALDLPEHVDVVALITPIELCSSRSRIVSRSTPCAKLECGAGVSEIVKTDALTRPQLPQQRSGGQGVASRQPSCAPLTFRTAFTVGVLLAGLLLCAIGVALGWPAC